MSSALCLMSFVLFGLASVMTGARIRQHRVQPGKGTYRGWSKEHSSFICLKKWKKNGWGKSTDQHCLIDLQQIIETRKAGAKAKVIASTRWGSCESKQNEYAMKLCNLKGKVDRRVSYASRLHVPKSCLSISPTPFAQPGKPSLTVFQPAVSARQCNMIIRSKSPGRGKFVPIPSTTPAATVVSAILFTRPFGLNIKLSTAEGGAAIRLAEVHHYDGKEARCQGIAKGMAMVALNGEALVGDDHGKWSEAGFRALTEKIRQAPLPVKMSFFGVPDQIPSDCLSRTDHSATETLPEDKLDEEIGDTTGVESEATDSDDGITNKEEVANIEDVEETDADEGTIGKNGLGDHGFFEEADTSEGITNEVEQKQDEQAQNNDNEQDNNNEQDAEDNHNIEDGAMQDEQDKDDTLEAELGETASVERLGADEEIDKEKDSASHEDPNLEIDDAGFAMLAFWRKKEANALAAKLSEK